VIAGVESPSALAVGAGSLWVADYDHDAITRIDLSSREVAEKPIPIGDGPTGLAVARRAVWVVNGNAGSVSKIDVARGEQDGDATVIEDGTRGGDSIAAGDDKVWTAILDGGVMALDAADGEVYEPIDLPGGAVALELALGAGGLWVLDDDGRVTRVDPASGEPGEPVKVGARLLEPQDGQLAVGEGAVWVALVEQDTVVRIDPRSRRLLRIPVPPGIAGDIAAGAGYVWLVDEDGRLVRIDPRTRDLVPSPLVSRFSGATDGGEANDLTAGEGALFIADFDRNTVTRVAP
jgi:DNA-binding beta-propeller fold protein YncE